MASRIGRIAQAAGLVMGAFVASRALGLAREIVVARQFGTSAELGAYLAAFRVPDFIFNLLAGGALGSSLIPVLADVRARAEEGALWRVTSAIYNLVGLLTTVSAALAFLLAPRLTRLLVPGYSPEMQVLTTDLMRIMLATPVIFGLSGISMAVLNAHEHFLLPAFAPIAYNLSIILGAVALAPRWGVYGLALGAVLGSGLHLVIQLPGLIQRGLRWSPILGLRDADVHEVIRLLLPRMLGLAALQLNFFVVVRLASGLYEESLPAINYAFLIMMLPQGVFAMAIATAAFPSFSHLAARKEFSEMAATLGATLQAMVFLAVPAAVGLLVLREPLIRVLLERGEFTGASTRAVAWALQFYLLGLPAYAVVEILSRAFYALHDTRTPVWVSAATVLLNIVLSLALVGPMDIGGLALANAVAVNLEMLILLWFIRQRLGELDGRTMLRAVGRVAVASGAMALLLMAFASATAGMNKWMVALGGLALGAGSYGAMSWLLGVDEVRAMSALILRKARGVAQARALPKG